MSDSLSLAPGLSGECNLLSLLLNEEAEEPCGEPRSAACEVALLSPGTSFIYALLVSLLC